MRKPILYILLILTAVLFFGGLYLAYNIGAFLPKHPDDIDQYMEARRVEIGSPGMAAGIIGKDGEIVWEGYYGTYDGENPVSEDTLFTIASISKTMIGTAAMQLWEQGEFELDDDINDYLDFEVRNPAFPDEPITFRQLMTHRSSISDRFPFYDSMYTIESGGGDSPWALGEFLQAYLTPEGEFYDTENFLDVPPDDSFDYSNYGAALLAYLVEVISGEDFAAYCQAHIFAPLGMEHSYFFLDEIPTSETELAVPFDNGEKLPQYSYPDYPAGSLKTTIADLGKFAAFYLDPAAAPVAILQPETVEVMFGTYGESTDLGEGQMGLVWVHMDWLLFNATGHTGGDPGVNTYLMLYPEDGYATILFMNGVPTTDRGVYLNREMLGRMNKQAEKLVP